MKNIIQFLRPFLIEFRAYRRHLGGKWYYVRNMEEVSGYGLSLQYWTNDEAIIQQESGMEIIKTEQYP